jgi:hypothetical protein
MQAPDAPPPSAPPTLELGTPWIAGAVAAEIFVFMALVVWLWVREKRRGHLKAPNGADAAGTVFGTGRLQVAALFVWRVLNFLWMAGLALHDWIMGGLRGWGVPPAYTQWCFRLQPFYWAFACGASLLYLRKAGDKDSPLAARINAATWMLFELCLSAAWLVTLVVFFLLAPGSPTIFVSAAHFWNTFVLTVELAINRLPVRAGHLIFMVIWVVLYCTYTWIMRTVRWGWFPYFFQDLNTPFALMWYPIISVTHFLVYFAIVGFSRCKEKRLDRGGCCCFCCFKGGSSSGVGSSDSMTA